MQKTCKNCAYWELFPIDGNAPYQRGLCRRFPPVADIIAAMHHLKYFKDEGYAAEENDSTEPLFWMQPSTYESGWCGEFKDARA